MSLLSISVDAKTKKGEKFGYLTGILYLAPSNESKVINTCPMASKGCRAACLFTAGRGAFDSVRTARINKTLRFVSDRNAFMSELCLDIAKLVVKAAKQNLTPAVRLNGTSDIAWENIPVGGYANIFEKFPTVTFYDYSKIVSRAINFAIGKMNSNYHLTFSRSESNAQACEAVAVAGGNVAVVFDSENFPETYLGRPVVSGDDSDLRFLDGKNVIVGLKSKGKARKDDSGFVVSTE